jgi:hypothetical protein
MLRVVSQKAPDMIPDEAPTVDADAVRERYRRQKAVRRAKIERQRRTKRAGARFWVVLLLLVVGFLVLAVSTWHEIGQLFGL